MALYGIESSAGLAGNRMLAAMAADASAPGRTTWVPAGQTAAWLRPRPVTALPGIGRATAATLSRYGLHTIGQVGRRTRGDSATPSRRRLRPGCWPNVPAATIPARSPRWNRQRI